MRNKKNIFQVVTNILTLIVMSIGATYAYFTVSLASPNNAVIAISTSFNVNLSIIAKYAGFYIVPTDDSDILVAYANQCIDSINNGACLAYDINVSNLGDSQSIRATADFTVNDIDNLSYLVLDENGDIYKAATAVGSGGVFSLGNDFVLDTEQEKTITIVIWITNLEIDQNETDAGGSFNVAVTITSIYGDKLTGSLEGSYGG